MAKFPFSDLHSFKNYVIYVQTYLPDQFPHRDGVPAADQWTLNLAFEGLRVGLNMAIREKGNQTEFVKSLRLVDEAFAAYNSGDIRTGFTKLEQVQKL